MAVAFTTKALRIFTNCTLNSDSASGYGGGIYNASGKVVISGSTLSNDRAGDSFYGGGIYNSDVLSVSNTTFVSNIAGQYGGGVYNASGTANTPIRHLTLT